MMLEALTSLLTLTVLEVVLSIDNLVVIAVLVGKLPREQQATARYTGMTLALVPRLGPALLHRLDHQAYRAASSLSSGMASQART